MNRERTAAPQKPGLYLLSELSADSLAPVEIRTGAGKPHKDAGPLQRIDIECFLCRRKLSTDDKNAGTFATKEDVFPRWLAERMALTGSGVNLLRGNWRKYRKVLVPCCRECNNESMSDVESRVSAGLRSFGAFQKLTRSDLGLWAAKVLYGLLHLEIKPWDPKSKTPRPGSVPESAFDHLPTTIPLLQGFRKRVVLDSPAWPFSILRFALKSGGPPELNFNFRDSVNWPVALAIRVDAVGFIVVFEDFGWSEHVYSQHLDKIVAGRQLHPLQFSEIVARIFYEAGLVQWDVRFTGMESTDGLYLAFTPTAQPSLEPDPARRARMIAEMTGQPMDQVWNPDYPDKTRSLLVTNTGSFADLPFEENIAYPM